MRSKKTNVEKINALVLSGAIDAAGVSTPANKLVTEVVNQFVADKLQPASMSFVRLSEVYSRFKTYQDGACAMVGRRAFVQALLQSGCRLGVVWQADDFSYSGNVILKDLIFMDKEQDNCWFPQVTKVANIKKVECGQSQNHEHAKDQPTVASNNDVSAAESPKQNECVLDNTKPAFKYVPSRKAEENGNKQK